MLALEAAQHVVVVGRDLLGRAAVPFLVPPNVVRVDELAERDGRFRPSRFVRLRRWRSRCEGRRDLCRLAHDSVLAPLVVAGSPAAATATTGTGATVAASGAGASVFAACDSSADVASVSPNRRWKVFS